MKLFESIFSIFILPAIVGIVMQVETLGTAICLRFYLRQQELQYIPRRQCRILLPITYDSRNYYVCLDGRNYAKGIVHLQQQELLCLSRLTHSSQSYMNLPQQELLCLSRLKYAMDAQFVPTTVGIIMFAQTRPSVCPSISTYNSRNYYVCLDI